MVAATVLTELSHLTHRRVGHHLPARIYRIFGWKKISILITPANFESRSVHTQKLEN